jgi:hypothetical protein
LQAVFPIFADFASWLHLVRLLFVLFSSQKSLKIGIFIDSEPARLWMRVEDLEAIAP